MQKLSHEEVEKTFGSAMYAHGRQYYEDSRVYNFKTTGHKITAYVAGSQLEPYEIEIDFAQGRYCCDCRDEGLCRHIAAVLIKYISDCPENNKSKQTTELEAATARLKRKRERKILLQADRGKNPFASAMAESFAAPEEKEKRKRYTLLFILEYNGSYLLKPALARLKQNGETGHIESFSYRKLTEPLSRQASMILKNLLSNNMEMTRLLLTLDMVDELGIPVFFENNRTPVCIKRAEHLQVNFMVNAICKNDEINFSPCLELLDSRGTGLKSFFTSDALDLGDECFCVYNNSTSTLAYCLDNDILAFIRIMEKNRQPCYSADIYNLKDALPAKLAQKIEINFPYTSISIANLEPRSVLTISEKEERLCASLSFHYHNHELPFASDREYLVDTSREQSDVLHLIARAHEYEQVVHDMLTELFEFGGENPFAYAYTKEENNTDFILSLSPLDFLIKYGDALMERRIDLTVDNKKVAGNKGKLAFKVNTGIDWFDMEGKMLWSEEDGAEEEFPLVIDPNLLSKGLIHLGDSYVRISREDLELIQELIEAGMDTSSVLKVSKLNFSLIDEIYLRSLSEEAELAEVHNISMHLQDFSRIEKTPPPAGFQGSLRHYQEAGYNWLNFMHKFKLGGCLADDMGLGKTVQTLAMLQGLKERDSHNFSTSLLILPVVTISNWEAEIEQFTPGLKVYRHAGSRRTKNIEELLEYDLILVSYHTIKNDIELFSLCRFYYIILDEAQYIKNASSQIFRAIRSLKSHYRLSLTGTPIENHTMELWSQMNFLNPLLFGSGKKFKQEFATPIERDASEDAVTRLRRLVFPFILRRKKEDVLTELPEKEEIVYYCEMKEEQKDLYNQIKGYYRERLIETMDKKGYARSAIEIFDSMLKLRQLAIFPELANSEYAGVDSCKFIALSRMIEEITAEDHKILIFSQFVKALDLIRNWCREKGLAHSYLSGSTTNRAGEISRFQKDADVKIFLLSLKAGGVGINLTAADYVVLLDPWWNPAAERQAIDRSYRMGQTRKVIAYKMIVKDTIEEKILRLQQRKTELVKELITEESNIFKSLGKDDILDLFK